MKSTPGHAIFLSCLCGSEGRAALLVRLHYFLSCLCGSEEDMPAAAADANFLSCLCGSEGRLRFFCDLLRFLSCLCGSEVEEAEDVPERSFSELPVRQ